MRAAPRHLTILLSGLLACEAILAGQGGGSALTLETLWTIRAFSELRWSPDSASVAFTVDDPVTNADTIYVAGVDGRVRAIESGTADKSGRGPKRSPRRALLERPWTPDGRQLLFNAGGELRSVDVASGQTRTLVAFAGPSPGYVPQEYFNGPDAVLAPDGRRIAFVRESEIWVLDVAHGGLRQLTATHGQGWHNLQPRWSPDGTRILFTAQATGEQKTFNGLDFSGLVMTPTFRLIGTGRVRLGVVSADGGPTSWLGPADGVAYSLRGGSQAHWSPDGRTIAINRITLDHKARELLLASPETGTVTPLWTERVERWISPMAIWIRWSPDSRRLVLTSEETGWNHVYVIDVPGNGTSAGAAPRALTSGSFTITSNQVYEGSESTPAWSPDGSTIFFPSNEAATAERHVYAVAAAGGARRRVTTQPGVDWASVVSPDGRRVAYLHSTMTTLPEVFVQDTAGGTARKLTSLSTPAALASHAWLDARLVSYKNRKDGKPVAARLYMPPQATASTRVLPAVIFVHGAGYTQSVYSGWPGSSVRSTFNEYLARRGYVVLDVDFRGSSGYGRAFREDVFDRMGEIDLEDVLSGVEYLKGLGSVDAARIGIWGHSYGGFLTSMAMFRASQVFAAGAAGAPVTDWERFYYLAPGYNEEHIGFPWENPEGTKRASPLTYAKDLERPFLLLSGVQDTMHLDSAALVNALLEHRKRVDWFFYPNEAHGLRQPQAKEDYYRRIAEFFDRHLSKPAVSSSQP